MTTTNEVTSYIHFLPKNRAQEKNQKKERTTIFMFSSFNIEAKNVFFSSLLHHQKRKKWKKTHVIIIQRQA